MPESKHYANQLGRGIGALDAIEHDDNGDIADAKAILQRRAADVGYDVEVVEVDHIDDNHLRSLAVLLDQAALQSDEPGERSTLFRACRRVEERIGGAHHD